MKLGRPGLASRFIGWWFLVLGVIGVSASIHGVLTARSFDLFEIYPIIGVGVAFSCGIWLGIVILRAVRQVDRDGEIPYQ
jgi:hypothetical protein